MPAQAKLGRGTLENKADAILRTPRRLEQGPTEKVLYAILRNRRRMSGV